MNYINRFGPRKHSIVAVIAFVIAGYSEEEEGQKNREARSDPDQVPHRFVRPEEKFVQLPQRRLSKYREQKSYRARNACLPSPIAPGLRDLDIA